MHQWPFFLHTRSANNNSRSLLVRSLAQHPTTTLSLPIDHLTLSSHSLMSMADLQPREYDFIVVGAGHNGLCCAAYLAREYQRRSALAAKARIVVLEQREAVGGACTMRTKTLADGSGVVKYSPCAYLCGLFHQRVIDELGLQQHGFHWTAAKTMFVPFADGSAVLLHDDASITEAEIVLLGAEADLEGWRAMEALFERTRQRLREGDSDIWLATQPPTPDDIRALLADDPGAHLITFPPQMCVRNMNTEGVLMYCSSMV